MDKRIFLTVVIIILLVTNLCIENFQTKLYNTYTDRDNSSQSSQFNDTYNIEDESIKFVYKFLDNWEDNLTLEYLDENLYNRYSGDKKYILENYMKNIDVVDKINNEVVLVKSGTSTDNVTKREYVNLTLYVTEKAYDYDSLYATEITRNSPDANKKITIVVYSDTPNNFKIRLFVEKNLQNDDGRSF
jgi:hypothetical protein